MKNLLSGNQILTKICKTLEVAFKNKNVKCSAFSTKKNMSSSVFDFS